MSTDVKITYINKSVNPARPTVFVFTKNQIPTFDALKDDARNIYDFSRRFTQSSGS